MLVCHSKRFILFNDPLGACPWIEDVLSPWIDQPVADNIATARHTYFFKDMSPTEAELAFDIMGLPFRSYRRIAIVRDPFAKMEDLYDRIADTDRLWQMRGRIGMGAPDYVRWLRRTRPCRNGAGNSASPRWRRFGAWTVRAWCDGRISHVIRAESAAQDILRVLGPLGVNPAIPEDTNRSLRPARYREVPQVKALIGARYHWDLRHYPPAQRRSALAA